MRLIRADDPAQAAAIAADEIAAACREAVVRRGRAVIAVSAGIDSRIEARADRLVALAGFAKGFSKFLTELSIF